jgi:DNA primase
MPGLISEKDLNELRDKARVDDIIREYVTLKSSGGGSYKGLCPFHDERSPSMHVTPNNGLWHCFGCGEGGDVFSFVQKIEHIGFPEAVERLAEKTGYTLSLVSEEDKKMRGIRTRLIHANKDAEKYFCSLLQTSEGVKGVDFLKNRGFSSADAEFFGIGYSLKNWDSLTQYLMQKGYSQDELVDAGLSLRGQNNKIYDRFRGRLMWPIRNQAGDTIGFGARKLYDDDEGPKYLNTPETMLYKKSLALYGIDLARKAIASKKQVVVVEGYTDVMACHLSGVDTAVAACGTAFGGEHTNMVRRLLMDDSMLQGEIIFTFDGDAAGQKAAMRAFDEDQKFAARTFVVVEPNGKDPCDVRMDSGNQGILDLMASKIPLFEFVIKTILGKHDLDTPLGRTTALRECLPIVSSIKDPMLKPEYARLLAGWVGVDTSIVLNELRMSNRTNSRSVKPLTENTMSEAQEAVEMVPVIEKNVLKCVLQNPVYAKDLYEEVVEQNYSSQLAKNIHRAIMSIGLEYGVSNMKNWVTKIIDTLSTAESQDLHTIQLVRQLAVEDMISLDKEYVSSVIVQFIEKSLNTRILEVKSRMSRETDPQVQGNLFTELITLENQRKVLQQKLADY